MLTSCFTSAFREVFAADLDANLLPAHIYMRSVHNITIERSWLRMRLDFGDNAVLFFSKGVEDGVYNKDDPEHWYASLAQSKCMFCIEHTAI